MGFFSKLTCDTKESVASVYSGHSNALRPVYMLQPNNQAPLREDQYEGYGVVGMNWFEWLSMTNYGVTDTELGIFLDCGKYYKDEKGVVYACKMHINEKSLRIVLGDEVDIVLFQDFATPIESLGGIDINTANKTGLIRAYRHETKYPVKLSYDPLAIYEEHPASKECPAQGFFFDDEL